MKTITSESLVMGKRLRELRTAKQLSFEELRISLVEKYNISISIDSLKNYEVSQSGHKKVNQKEGMSIKYLRCFADFYGVSADYLLGMDVPQTPDITVREMTKKTGLSENVIEAICVVRDRYPNFVSVLNLVLEGVNLFDLTKQIGHVLDVRDNQLFKNGIVIGRQQVIDVLCYVLNDKEIMGKDIFGKKRIPKVVGGINHYLENVFTVAWGQDPETRNQRIKLDEGLLAIVGEENFAPFPERYEYIKECDL